MVFRKVSLQQQLSCWHVWVVWRERETVRKRQLLLIYSQDWPRGHRHVWIKVIVFSSLETFAFLLTQRSIVALLEKQVLEVARCDRMCRPVCVYRTFFPSFSFNAVMNCQTHEELQTHWLHFDRVGLCLSCSYWLNHHYSCTSLLGKVHWRASWHWISVLTASVEIHSSDLQVYNFMQTRWHTEHTV